MRFSYKVDLSMGFSHAMEPHPFSKESLDFLSKTIMENWLCLLFLEFFMYGPWLLILK